MNRYYHVEQTEGRILLVGTQSQITVTIHGPQGSGKSTLADRIAQAFKEEVDKGNVKADRLLIEESHSDKPNG